MWSEKCLRAKCDMVHLHRCPDDSLLIIDAPPPGECCSPPGRCHCDIQKCYRTVPVCEEGLERIMLEEGTSEPGHCCDLFECKPPELHCESVRCERQFLDSDEEECPDDSIRATSYVPAGSCCPINAGCRCRASICVPASCPEGEKLKILRKGDGTPGHCCDRFKCVASDDVQKEDAKRCPYHGEIYDDGEEWNTSSCEQCKCKGGIALCSQMTCSKPSSHCTWVAVPENECCPVCLGCQTDDKKHKLNETWHKDDCTSCSCGIDGIHYCQKHMCQVQCDNPRKISGQCCPVCDEPTVVVNPAICPSIEHCPLRCENGLLRDSQGCFQCLCAPVHKQNTTNCQELSESNCDKICAHGYWKDEKSCAVCKCAKCPALNQCYKHCLYGFESNSNGCAVCKCRAISRMDAKLLTIGKESIGWDKCYSTSAQTGKIVERDSGEWWSDGCRHCFCEQKYEFCSLISCRARNESCPLQNWKTRDGECCATCDLQRSSTITRHEHTVCQSAGRLFVDGETWQLAPCTSCTCRVGNVLCRVVECPPIACAAPVFNMEDQCCPICPKVNDITASMEFVGRSAVAEICTDNQGAAHAAGSSWRTDDCTSCKCTVVGDEVKIECFKENCSKFENCLGLPLTIKGRCCPVCSDALSSGALCTYKGNSYSVREEWRDGHCRNCTCQFGGQTMCKEQQCAPCNEPVYLPAQCCPICKDNKNWERYGENGIYFDNKNENNSSSATTTLQMNSIIYGVSLVGGIIIALIAVYLIYKCVKNITKSDEKKSPIQYNSSTILLGTKAIGSTSRLYENASARNDSCDGQSESLLSSASNTSTTDSSNASSCNGAHYDRLPLNPVKKSVIRTKSMDCGSRRNFNSFRNSAFGKIGNKHGSCNV